MKDVGLMKVIDYIAGILVVIGALNWGLVGAFHFNLVTSLLGDMTVATRIIYILVGLSGLWSIYAGWRCCYKCRRKTEGEK